MKRMHGQKTHSTKMGAKKSTENTSNAPNFICPSPKVWDFDEKRLHWASVVRARMSLSHRKARELHKSDTKNMTHNVLYIASKSLEDIYFHIYLVEVDILTPFNVPTTHYIPSTFTYKLFYCQSLFATKNERTSILDLKSCSELIRVSRI